MQNDRLKIKKNVFIVLNNVRYFAFYILIFAFLQGMLFIFPNLYPVSVYSNEVSNNKYGIHLAQPHKEAIQKAAELVNSSGGDWGYVTLVIEERDRNTSKWQEIFDLLRINHLIPIIRLATQPEGDKWKRPSKDDADSWVVFLESLNWVVKNRYIVLFNEPNHGAEWGGEVDPGSYAEVAFTFAKKLKEKNPDYFIMLAGFDASAPSMRPNYEDEEVFLKEIVNYLGPVESFPPTSAHSSSESKDGFVKDKADNSASYSEELSPTLRANGSSVFDYIDGWASHSYPNPGFSGSPWDSGRRSVRGYEWELAILQNMGITKNLPVFITETGWSDKGLSRETIADYYYSAFNSVWGSDNRVVAVTPFVLDYQGEPFLNFSWRKYQSDEYYPQFEMVRALSKQKGEPFQIEKGEVQARFPQHLVARSSYQFSLKLKNSGQAIWDKDQGYTLKLDGFEGDYFFSDLHDIKPFEETEVKLFLKTNGALGTKKTSINLYKKEEKIAESSPWIIDILPLPHLTFKAGLFMKLNTTDNDFEIQVFDEDDRLVYKKKGMKVVKSQSIQLEVQNIALGRKYRIVILKSGYLPRQNFIVFNRDNNSIQFEKMLPFDPNNNGKFDGGDLMQFVLHPRLLRMLLP